MRLMRETYDGTQQEYVNKIISRIRPTADTGEQLERRIQGIQSLISDKCGEFGGVLATGWPQGERETAVFMPIFMADRGKIDAVLEISVCLYDDLQYPNKLTN